MKNLLKIVVITFVSLTSVSVSVFAQDLGDMLVCTSEERAIQVIVAVDHNVGEFRAYGPQGDLGFVADLGLSHLATSADAIEVSGRFSDDEGSYGVDIKTKNSGVESFTDEDGNQISLELFRGQLQISHPNNDVEKEAVVCVIVN